jgi:hypothetical protein
MPSSIARSEPASSFGRPATPAQDRWPAPLAAAVILALSAAGWALIFQGVRLAANLVG